MRTTLGQDVASIAAGLGNDQIHVWRLRYERAWRREPLCALLGIYLGLPAGDIALVDGKHGRPELAEPWNGLLQFNWSHSGDTALVALARRVAPGVDIERLRPRARAMQLADRFFHPEETAALASLDATEREQAFLQLWTGKEAVLKAMGRGIAFGLDRLRLAVAPAAPQVIWLDGDDPAQWQLHPLQVDSSHVASLAWRGPAQAIACWTLADSG
ncbi:4'-phosphopantetheinyl transferase family protein [Dyella humi]|uniref:4'-phosphopantetheinyl transferase superfamily protein n=1 Tax=Dyella humi TaxID=1770547 RepID=A0ABW8IML0_9GAMM